VKQSFCKDTDHEVKPGCAISPSKTPLESRKGPKRTLRNAIIILYEVESEGAAVLQRGHVTLSSKVVLKQSERSFAEGA